jgi:archaemetzincin
VFVAVQSACDRADEGGVVTGGADERESPPAVVPSATRDDVPLWAVDDGRDFEPLPTSAPGDWLDVHHEFGQSFAGFVGLGPNRPDETRSVLVLQPIGRFDHPSAPPIGILRRFTETYFGMNAQVLPAVNLDHVDVTSRRVANLRRPQLLTGELLDLLRRNLPEHAFCSIGITMQDLYPGPDWNYVFGQASLRDRVAVYSFVRYLPAFWGEETDDPALVLRRSCKVLAHETAHAFGIRHCTACLCVMNGSNHLVESDTRPLRMCPNDLRKLQWSVGFDAVERYRRLATLYRELGFDDEAAWIDRRLRRIGG